MRALQRDGWNPTSQKGSHIRLVKRIEGTWESIIFPRHRTIKKGTLRAILRDAEMTIQRLLELL